MSRVLLRSSVVRVSALLLLVACTSTPVDPGRDATLNLFADVSGTTVATVVVEVSAPDIPATLIFNIPVTNGAASGTVVIPAGSDRTIMMRAYDAAGVQTHKAQTTVTIQQGANTSITLTMQPLTGDLPINVTLGSMSVAVAPSTLPLILTTTPTGQLSVTVRDWNGVVVIGAAVKWATQDPGIATVDGAGLVTAQGTGTTKIVATYLGAAGQSTVTVQP